MNGMGNTVVETLIGAVVLVVAGIFVVFAYTSADVAPRSGYQLVAKFDRVDGLTTGSDVRMSGIKVGTVVDQRLEKDTFLAAVRINMASDIEIPEDSAIKVTSDGLLGDTYMSIEPGGSETALRDGDEIRFTQGSVNIIDLVGQAVFGSAGSSPSGTSVPQLQ